LTPDSQLAARSKGYKDDLLNDLRNKPGYAEKYRAAAAAGRFREETDAAQAYNLAAEELFGEFARFNEAQDNHV
jgi:hypothetical protein